MKYKHYILPENIWSGDLKDNYKSRSSIGKKAYQTFLKNGGSRDIKGRFCGPITLTLSGNTHIVTTGSYKKEKIDWEIIGSDLYRAYMNTSGTLAGYNRQNHAKAYAKVFQKHGLIKEEIEI